MSDSTFLSFLHDSNNNTVDQNEVLFQNVSLTDSMQNDFQFAAKSVKINGEALRFFDYDVRNDFHTVKLAMQRKKSALRHATQQFRSNPEHALLLMREFGGTIYTHFIGSAKKDLRVCRLCFVELKCGNKIAEAPACIKQNKGLVLEIIKSEPRLIKYLNREFWTDLDILTEAYGNPKIEVHSSRVTRYIEGLSDVVHMLVSKCGWALRALEAQWSNREVVLLALRNGLQIGVKHPIIHHFYFDNEVLQAVVKNSPECVMVFGKRVDQIREAVAKNERCVLFISKAVKEADFVRKVTEANWRVCLYFDATKYLTDEDYMRVCAQPGALKLIFKKLRFVNDSARPKDACIKKAAAALKIAETHLTGHAVLNLFFCAVRVVRPMALLTFMPWGNFVQVNKKIAEYAGLPGRRTYYRAMQAKEAIESLFHMLDDDEKIVLI
jgi:hypothetical protein